jgi:uncharacterized protein YggE
MTSFFKCILPAALALAAPLQAQTLVVIPAFGEVTHANDEALVTFTIEEQDKDKAAAASRVNLKMKQGMEAIRKEDPQAVLKTLGYYSYPVYPEERPVTAGSVPKPRLPASWRIGQSLEVRTGKLDTLPKTVAGAQRLLALNGLQFGLASATQHKLDAQRIAAAYANLRERIASVAAAMGRPVGEAVIDTVDFEGSGNYTQKPEAPRDMPPPMLMRAAKEAVAEPSFEAGETTLQMQLVGKVKFK